MNGDVCPLTLGSTTKNPFGIILKARKVSVLGHLASMTVLLLRGFAFQKYQVEMIWVENSELGPKKSHEAMGSMVRITGYIIH